MSTDLNTNPFDQDFCSYLEFHLCAAFKNSKDKTIQGLWCDGINDEALNKSKKNVNDTRQLITKAWIGPDGQDEYEMTIHFGPKSLSKYAKDLDLKSCVPPDSSTDWIAIDTDTKTIHLRFY